jgi:hypothetical protein
MKNLKSKNMYEKIVTHQCHEFTFDLYIHIEACIDIRLDLNDLLTLLCLGEENIYLDDFDVKLRKKLLCTLFFFKISIPAETNNESFLTSCLTSKKDVLTYIFNDLMSKVGPRRHSVTPISPGRGKNLPR